jgi:hypothetical protein
VTVIASLQLKATKGGKLPVKKLRQITFIGFAAFISAALCSTAQAQYRVFVSGLGNDLNPCTRTAPCRNFQRGHDAVVAGGEVVALDSAGYGAVTISKAVTIDGAGQHAGITAISNAITFDAAGAKVALRGLTLNSAGGVYGIHATAVNVLHIERLVVNGFFTGIAISLNADGSEIYLKDTIVRNSTGNIAGIFIQTQVGTVRAAIDHCRAENNSGVGFYASQRAQVTVSNSVAAGNSSSGFLAFFNMAEGPAEMNADQCVAINNSNGFSSLDYGVMRVARSTATNNDKGFFNFSGGTFESLGDNLVRGNTSNIVGTITVVPGK